MPEQPTRPFTVMLREPAPWTEDGFILRRWRISRARLPQSTSEVNYAECCYKSRSIVIHAPLSDEDFWSTLGHEIDHVSYPDMDEGAILRGEYNRLAIDLKAKRFVEDEG